MRVTEPLEKYHHYILKDRKNKLYRTSMVKLTTSKIFPELTGLLGEVDYSEGDYLSVEEVVIFHNYIHHLTVLLQLTFNST
jgi:hypothetical protein